MYCSEQEFKDGLTAILDGLGYDRTPIYIAKREGDSGSLSYKAIASIPTTEDNEELIRAVMRGGLDNDYHFIGSEMVADSHSIVDNIFVAAQIKQNLGA